MRLLFLLLCFLFPTTAFANPWGSGGFEERLLLLVVSGVACFYAGISTLALLYYKFQKRVLLTFMCRAGLLLYSVSLGFCGSLILAGFRSFFPGKNVSEDRSFLLLVYVGMMVIGIFSNSRYLRRLKRQV